LERDHHDADDGKEEDVPSGELILRETEPRQRRNHHAADRGDRSDNRAVEQITQEWLALEDFEIVGEVEPVVRSDLKRHALDLGGGFQRRDGHPEEREEDNDGATRNRKREEPPKAALPEAEGAPARQRTR